MKRMGRHSVAVQRNSAYQRLKLCTDARSYLAGQKATRSLALKRPAPRNNAFPPSRVVVFPAVSSVVEQNCSLEEMKWTQGEKKKGKTKFRCCFLAFCFSSSSGKSNHPPLETRALSRDPEDARGGNRVPFNLPTNCPLAISGRTGRIVSSPRDGWEEGSSRSLSRSGRPASGPRCFPVGVSGHVVAPRGPGLPPAWEGRPLFLFPASDGGAPAFVGLSLGNFLRRWEEGGKTSSFTMGIRRLRASASLYGMPLGSLTLPFGGAAKALRLTACLSASLLCVGRYIPYFEGW